MPSIGHQVPGPPSCPECGTRLVAPGAPCPACGYDRARGLGRKARLVLRACAVGALLRAVGGWLATGRLQPAGVILGVVLAVALSECLARRGR